ncbi:general transcription factor IIF subunit 2-like [Halichoeres trimaculatus]|uniref:general transcription factor IIF subunit 2-like n=1 Tax=Halichoeres trimaculatus TaxID=147232 RepID=UPI003D9F52A4
MSENKEVNLTGVKHSYGVWLVKVPKYISQQWDKATEKGEVGKITIGKKQGKTEVRFSLNEELAALGDVGEKNASLEVPRDHPFTMHSVGGQTMAAFSQSDTDGISQEGIVVHRAECRPVVNDNYMKLKKNIGSLWAANCLRVVISCAIFWQLDYAKKKKSEGKMVRAERQVVLDMLFSAFEKHQYYNIKDLVDITKQPVTYLKDIMREIGSYNSKGLHKSTWELKPDYRHYQSTGEEEEMQTA